MASDKPVASANGAEEADLAKVNSSADAFHVHGADEGSRHSSNLRRASELQPHWRTN